MGRSVLDDFSSPDVRREVELRLELWRKFLGSGPPEDLRRRAREASYKVPRPYGFAVDVSGHSDFSAETWLDPGPFVEFSVGVSFALRVLCAAMVASDDLLVGLHEPTLEKATPPFPRAGIWSGAANLVRSFSEDAFMALRERLERTGISAQPARLHLASTLSMQIESFILLHELGHHRMAHVQYLGRQLRDAPPFLLHTFELEADRNAISTMFNSFYASFELIDPAAFTAEMRSLQTMVPLSRWRLWTTMIGLLFLVLEVSNPGTRLPHERRMAFWKSRSATSHPPPLYRMKHAVIWARTLIPQDDRQSETYRLAVGYALADIGRMADRLGVPKPLRYFQMETSSYETKLSNARAAARGELDVLLDELDITEYENL